MVERFRLLGRAMAKALQDSRLLDIPLSYTFYRSALVIYLPLKLLVVDSGVNSIC